jgi:hypothetical protein
MAQQGRFLASKLLYLTVLIFWLSAHHAQAASVNLVLDPSSGDVALITIEGAIVEGDADEFLRLSLEAPEALVVLNSPGGLAMEGINIGRLIRKAGYSTAVLDGHECMSACGLIWLSGKIKFLAPSALVGFHAVYNDFGVSSSGNAIFGAYYGSLGLSDRTIAYLTSAPPEGMNVLTWKTASLFDIDAKPLVVDAGTPAEPKEFETESGSGRFVTAQNTAVIGFDYDSGPDRSASARDCERRCATDRSCKAFTYDTKAKLCYLKTGGRLTITNGNSYSGLSRDIASAIISSKMRIHFNQDSPGQDIGIVRGISREECMYQCEFDMRCKAFTYVSAKQACLFKSGHSKLIRFKGALTGTR